MQGKTRFYKTKRQNNCNNEFYTTSQTGQSDKEKQKHLLNKKKQSNWHYNKGQNNYNNEFYTTSQTGQSDKEKQKHLLNKKKQSNWHYNKGQNNYNNEFYTTSQTGQSDKEKQKHLLNKKKQSNWHYNKGQNNCNNEFYATNQIYDNHGYYEKRDNLHMYERKIFTTNDCQDLQDLTEEEIYNVLNDICKYTSSGGYNKPNLSFILGNLAKQKKLNYDQINWILQMAKGITIRARIYVIKALIEYQTLQNGHISYVLDIIKPIEEFKTKYYILLDLINKQQEKLADKQISEILDIINDWDIGYQICVLEKLCQVRTLSQAQIDKIFKIMSKFQPSQQVNLLRYSSEKQKLSDQQIDELLESNALSYLAINNPIGLFRILKRLVEVQNLSEKQIDTTVFLISQLRSNQQGYMLYSLIMHKAQQLINKHIKQILDIISNLEMNQIVKIIKEVEPQQLPLFVLNTSLLLTSLDNNNDKDLAEELVSEIKNHKINLEEQRRLLLSLLITLDVSKEQANDIAAKIYTIALQIITMTSSSKQQVFLLAALIKGEAGNISERYIDIILNKIGIFNLKEFCCVLNFLTNEQKLSAKHMDAIIDMIARGIVKSDKIQERVYVLDSLIDKNQKSLMGEHVNKILNDNRKLLTGKHIDKILEVTPKLIQEQQIDVLDNLGKTEQLEPEHISKILKIIKLYQGTKKERLLLEYFIKGKQLNQGHISTVIEIIELYIKQNPNSEKCGFILVRLLEQKQLELTKKQVNKIMSMITSLKSEERSPVLQALIRYGRQQEDQLLVDNIFKMIKNLKSREQSFVLECFSKEKFLTEIRIGETLSMMTNWTSREKRHVLVALIQYEKEQMNESCISAIFKIVKHLEPSDLSLVLECLAKEKFLTKSQINQILNMPTTGLTNEQQMFVITALVQRQSLDKEQIPKIVQIIASFDIKIKRRFLSFGLLGYLIKNPEAKFKYKQICEILIEAQKSDKALNNKHEAKKQMTEFRGFFLKNFLDKVIKKTVLRILKKDMPVIENKQVNKILSEEKKVDTSLKISTKWENDNKKSILEATVDVKNYKEDLPMLQTGNDIYGHNNI